MARAFIPHVVTEDSALGGSFLERSLRFHSGDNTRLVRTIGSTSNRRTFTYSWWLKRSIQNSEQYIWYVGSSSGTPYLDARFEANSHELQIQDYTPSRPIRFITNRKFRDCTAWYHFVFAVDTTQSTASNRAKLYVNGVQETSFSTETYPDQNYDSSANVSGHIQVWGTNKEGTSNDLDGYLAEAHFIDGQQLTPSSFGYTEFQTGIWKPKRYTGTYGTNGFYLNFSDNSGTSATTMGRDSSGNGNNFTPNNFAVSDSMIDTPTNNFPLMFTDIGSPSLPATITEAGLRVQGPTSHSDRYIRTLGGMPNSGKYYVEIKCVHVGARGTVGMYDAHENGGSTDGGTSNWFAFGNHNGGYSTSWTRPNYTQFGTFQTGEYMTIALDMDNGKIWLNRNAAIDTTTQDPRITDVNTSNPDRHYTWFYRETSSNRSTSEFNFGQQSYNFTPPDGFKPLATNNFPTQQTPHVISPKKHFDTLLYTGNGGTQSITGLEFQPDWVWLKKRNGTTNHLLFDSVRGTNKSLNSNGNGAEDTSSTNKLTSFNSDGFTLGSNASGNNNSDTYVAWCWKAGGGVATNTNGNITSSVSVNEEAGFSIVSYTGNGSNGQTVGHGLSQAPKWIMLKARDATQNWRVWHHSLAADGSKRLILDQTNVSENAAFLNDTAPTSTVFTLGNADDAWNANSAKFIAYCWHEVPGFSKFGVYKGNNNSNGPYIHLGFRPAWIMIKNISAGSTAWYILDNKRDPDNPVQQYLAAEDSAAEGTYVFYDFLSNGFKLRNTGGAQNPNNQDVVYMAFAEQPGSTAYDTETNAR